MAVRTLTVILSKEQNSKLIKITHLTDNRNINRFSCGKKIFSYRKQFPFVRFDVNSVFNNIDNPVTCLKCYNILNEKTSKAAT